MMLGLKLGRNWRDSRIPPLGTKNQFWIHSDGAASQRRAQLAWRSISDVDIHKKSSSLQLLKDSEMDGWMDRQTDAR